MSRKENCWDNAAMVSFFEKLKVEPIYTEDLKEKATRILVCFSILKCSTTPSDAIRQTATLALKIMKITIMRSAHEAASTARGDHQ